MKGVSIRDGYGQCSWALANLKQSSSVAMNVSQVALSSSVEVSIFWMRKKKRNIIFSLFTV